MAAEDSRREAAPAPAEPPGSQWNAAFRRGEAAVPRLEPNQDYFLSLRLGWLPPEAGVLQVAPSEALTKKLDQLVAESPAPAPLSLTVHLLLDDTHFASDGGARPLQVDVAAYKRWRDGGRPEAGVLLGRTRFPVRTGSKRTETARVALLVWSEDTPIDELALSVCIGVDGPDCRAPRPLPTSEEADPVRPVASSRQPDASLHVVELRTRTHSSMVALFKERGHKPVSWSLDLTAERLKEHVSTTLSRAFGAAAAADSEQGLLEGGWALFKLLFPWHDADTKQVRAHATFADFVRRRGSATAPPTLFARIVFADGVALALPLGLMALKGEDRKAVPIGFSVSVETPLPHQDFEGIECPRRWHLLLPEPKKDYGDGGVLGVAADTVAAAPALLPADSDTFKTERDFEKFRSWLEEEEADAQTVLLILSHHAANSIWFESRRPLTSLTIGRSFARPTVAILNGCGTMEASAAEFAHALNDRGATAILATATSVGGQMAGDFARCLLAQARDAPRDGIPLSSAHFKAITCLRNTKHGSATYGARALVFALLGNGAVRLCPMEPR